MKSSYLTVILCLAALAAFVRGSLQPAADARENFSTNFYRTLVYTLKKGEQDFLISPAAVQKMLTIVYNGADDNLADKILWDLRLKHIDNKRLHEDAKREGIIDIGFAQHLKQTQIKELSAPILREDVLNYFSKDFVELKENLMINNTLLAKRDLKFSAEFKKFATEYFETSVADKDGESAASTDLVFGKILNDTADVEILSSVALQAHWKTPFELVEGQLATKGKFKYGEYEAYGFTTHVIELPLKANVPLNMVIIAPVESKDFDYLLSQIMGRSLNDFNEVSLKLKEEVVEVKLPKIHILSKTNLADYFSEIAVSGVHDIFTKKCQLTGIFENLPADGVTVASFWQRAIIDVNEDGIGSPEKQLFNSTSNQNDLVATHTFDVTSKPFFFVVKSDNVLYWMGHRVNNS